MTDELKECPFCGGEAEKAGYQSCDCCNKAWNGTVKCTACRAEFNHFDSDEEAAVRWNTRANQSLISELVLMLEVADYKISEAIMAGQFEDYVIDNFQEAQGRIKVVIAKATTKGDV